MTCTHCGKPIAHENSDDEFLRLSPLPREGGSAVTDTVWMPEIAGPLDFCAMKCLCQWTARQRSTWTGKLYTDTASDVPTPLLTQ